MSSLIYFAQAGGETGAIKIGTTAGDPFRRVAGLQTGCPERIRLLGAVVGDQTRERRLHEIFSLDRLAGEWFNPSPALVSVVGQILAGTYEWPVTAGVKRFPATGIMLARLMATARGYCAAEGLALATVSTRIFNDGKTFALIEHGGDILTRRFERAMRWFSEHWPDGAEWPAEIARPEPSEPARVAS